VASVGTDGDLYPFLALGREFQRRGFRVTLASHEHFRSRANQAGLEFESLVSESENEELLGREELWHPIKSGWVIARWGARLVPRQYETLRRLAAPGNAVLVAGPGVIAARILQERHQTPLASVILQPWILPSLVQPPVMMGGLTLPRWTPRLIRRCYFRLIDEVGTRLMGSEVRRLRSSLGLKPLRRMFRWWLSPDLAVGLFPDWFASPPPDWPKQLRLAGFPLTDGGAGGGVAPDLLRFCEPPNRVVAFTFGTGMRHAGALFHAAVEVCRRLGVRGVLLTGFAAQVPRDLPEFMRHCEFAPFREFFPCCAAVVHHGGIGTTAKALAAGAPQLILPFAFDQLDNALRVKALGAGDWVGARDRQIGKLAAALEGVCGPATAAAARLAAGRSRCRSGVETAADFIEEITHAPPGRP